MVAAFERTYLRHFGRIESAMSVEVVSWRMVVSGPRVEIDLARARPRPSAAGAAGAESPVRDASPTPSAWRDAWFEKSGGFLRTPVYDRYALAPGDQLTGPALVEERESTVVVPPAATARCDDSRNLVIDLA